MRRFRRLVLLTSFFGVFVAGCSSSSSDGSNATPSNTTGDSTGDAGGGPGSGSGDDAGTDSGPKPQAENGAKDGTETDVDCGGNSPGVARCGDGKKCLVDGDCSTAFCSAAKTCAKPTGTDGAKNGDESDVDCGGTTTGAVRCATDAHCVLGADCESKVCGGANTCLAATHEDGVQNGDESDVDCGGTTTGAPRCVADEKCVDADDCASFVCGADKLCDAPLATDGVKNGDETDIDCGGATGAPACAVGDTCLVDGDCLELRCGHVAAGTCDAPSYTDTVKNGDETDVDCGGDPAHPCAVGKACEEHTDCVSNGCAYNGLCAPRASCTALDGGNTCRKADGTAESCCKGISVVPTGKWGSTTIPPFTVDKYLATAGRMRAFLTRVNGDVRSYMETHAPDWWDPRWTPWLPSSFNGHVADDYANPIISTTVKGWNKGEYTVSGSTASSTIAAHDITLSNLNVASAWAQVGGAVIYDQGSQGCNIGTSYGHPTYFVPQGDANALYGDNYERWMSQAALDQRPINCTPWTLLAALCAFDGGKMISKTQYDYIYDDTGVSPRSTYPWGSPPAMTCSGGTCTPGAGYDKLTNPHPGGYASIGTPKAWSLVGPATDDFSVNACPDCADDWINWQKSYQDPAWSPWQAGLSAAEQSRRSRDESYFISVPGTFPKGASRKFNNDENDRVQDIAGLMIEATLQAKTATAAGTVITFGDADANNDFAAYTPAGPRDGGSFEGHAVQTSGSYPTVTTKYGKMSVRCVY